MSEIDAVRIDVWLWAVRAFKTRALAATACKKGRVSVAGRSVKPARLIRPGDTIEIGRRFMTQKLRVVALLESRVGASLVENYSEDLTPEDVKQAAQEQRKLIAEAPARDVGMGRPTKKDRREIDAMDDDEARKEALFEKWVRKHSGL